MMLMSIQIHTLFQWCNDVAVMRDFYTNLLGLSETFYRDDDQHGWLAYYAGQTQVVFIRADNPLPIEQTWAMQPGYQGGSSTAKSWLFTVSVEDFATLSERIRSSNVTVYNGKCDNTCQLFIKDPMGMTIEISVDNQL